MRLKLLKLKKNQTIAVQSCELRISCDRNKWLHINSDIIVVSDCSVGQREMKRTYSVTVVLDRER